MTSSDGQTTSTTTGESRGKGGTLPSFALPTAMMVAVTIAAAAAVGALVAGVLVLVQPAWTSSAVWGAVAAAVGSLTGALVIRPWKVRPFTRWPMVMFAGQGVSMAGVTLAGGLLYWAAQPGSKIVFGLVAVAAFVPAMFAQVAVFSRRMAGASA